MPSKYSKKMFAHCVTEVARLASQEFFKNDDLLLADLAKALAFRADDEAHATKMISAWKSSTKAMLHESELLELADATASRGELPAGCRKCLGTDFIIVEKDGVSGVKRCSCPRGRKLAMMDHERKYPKPNAMDWERYFADQKSTIN